jgi:hypothetical protein
MQPKRNGRDDDVGEPGQGDADQEQDVAGGLARSRPPLPLGGSAAAVEVLHQPHGSFVEPAVRAFLDRMLPSKAGQTAGYEQVILAAFDRSFVGDPESFQRQLGERAKEIPAN